MFLCCCFITSAQQSDLLKRKISLKMNNVPVETVLKAIATQGGFTFAYNAEIIDGNKNISPEIDDRSVKDAIDYLFSGKIQCSAKGNHVILTLSPPTQNEVELNITGEVIDGATGKKLAGTSVYDKNTSASVITSADGRFTIKWKVKKSGATIKLFVSKANYRDTLVDVNRATSFPLQISIFTRHIPEPEDNGDDMMDSINKSIDALLFKMMLNQTEKTHMINITDTLRRKFQLGFVPFVGTNMLLSGNTVNDYSLNILMGYSMGTSKMEIAGLINADRGNAGKLQLAGLANVVSGSFRGLQAAGLVNTVFRETKGLQLAGLINTNLGDVQGGQISGLLNVNLKQTNAFQIAGLSNVALKDVNGSQLAGLMNVTLGRMKGMQVAGLINYATTLHGSQLGFLNLSDSCSGVPVGFLSFVNKGYHKFEISTDEVMPLNTSLRTGVRSFYNIINAGMQLKHTDTITWSFGYGVGSALLLSKKSSMNFDITVNQLMIGNRITNFNPWAKFSIMYDWQFTKGVSIAAGPVLNAFWVKTSDPDYEKYFKEIPPYTFANTEKITSNGYVSSVWVGGKLALRFF
jgi:hypothetical protein